MDKTIKITLKAARVNANLSQAEAAKELGVDRTTLQNYEKGKTIPKWDVVLKIGELYQIPVDSILFGVKSA